MPTNTADRAPRPPAPQQASYHRRTRRAHASEQAEDYVEAIADLAAASPAGGGARVVDLARALGVSHVTVIRTIARLSRDGYVVTKPYKAVQLSPSGQRLAARVRERHEIVIRFLLALGLDLDTARTDAEGLEHHVSAKTLAALARFAEAHTPKA